MTPIIRSRRAALLTFLFLTPILATAPMIVLAVDPPTFDCEVVIPLISGAVTSGVTDKDSSSARDAHLYLLSSFAATGGTASINVLYKIDDNCSIIWQTQSEDDYSCSDGSVSWTAVVADNAGRVAMLEESQPDCTGNDDESHLVLYDTDTGMPATDCTGGSCISEDITAVRFSGTATSANDVGYLRQSSTTLHYGVSYPNVNDLLIYDQNLVFVQRCDTTCPTNAQTIRPVHAADEWTVARGTGGDRGYTRVDDNAERLATSSTLSATNGYLAGLQRSKTDTTKAWSVTGTTSAGLNLCVNELTYLTMAFVQNCGALTGDQVDDGVARETTQAWYDLDDQDRFLVCGSYESGGDPNKPRAYIGAFSTTANLWYVTFAPGGVDNAGTRQCWFDQGTPLGLWVTGKYNSGSNVRIWVRHYTGGGFARAPEDLIALPGVAATTTPTTFTAGPIDVSIKNACAIFNACTTGGLFVWGLILLISAIAAVAVIAARLGFNPGTPGAVTMFGGIIALGIIGIWPLWAVIVLGVLTAAVVTLVVTRISGGFGA